MATRADVAQTAEKRAQAPGPLVAGAFLGAALVGLLGIVFLLVGMSGAEYQGKVGQVETNTDSAFLPASAQSTKVSDEAQQFQSVQAMPGSVVYQRRGGLTQADRAAITAEVRAFQSIPAWCSDQVGSPQFSADGAAAAVNRCRLVERVRRHHGRRREGGPGRG